VVNGGFCVTGTVTGVTAAAPGQNAEIHAVNNLVVDRPITAGDAVRLLAETGTITQSATGVISGLQLSAQAGVSIQLATTVNNVRSFAALTTGGIDFLNEGTLAITQVLGGTCVTQAVNGVVSTGGGNINVFTQDTIPGNGDGHLLVLSLVDSTGVISLTGQNSVLLAANVGDLATPIVNITAQEAAISRTAGVVTGNVVNLFGQTGVGSGTITNLQAQYNVPDWNAVIGTNPTAVYVSAAQVNVSGFATTMVNGEVWLDVNPITAGTAVDINPFSAAGNVVITSLTGAGTNFGTLNVHGITSGENILI
jgi:hypothetical protein